MKYILYCRKSTDTEDKQVLSLDSQEGELLELATRLGLNVIKVLRESRSAKEPGRPIFDEMLEFISKGKADGIICWKIDRLTRNPVDGGKIQWLLQQNKIKSIYTPSRTYFPSDNVMLMSIEQAMATQYIRDLSDNVKRGNRTKLEQGGWPHKAPFGYTNDVTTKKLILDEPRSTIARKIFDFYASGHYSMNDIVERLTSEGFITASGTHLNKSLIERTIKNSFYMGVMFSNGKYYEGKHEAIITKATYEQAQEVLARTTRPRMQTLLFPLRGVLKCAYCTCQYTASLKKGHEYYYCTNGKRNCEAHTRYLRSEPATKLVSKALAKVRIDEELIEIMYDAKREMSASTHSYAEAVRARLQGQLGTLEAQELKAFEDSSSGILRQELYEHMMLKIKKSRILIKKELGELHLKEGISTLEPIRDAFLRASTMQKLFLKASPEQKKMLSAEVLWNLLVKDGETQEVQYKSFYQVLANAPKKAPLEIMLRD